MGQVIQEWTKLNLWKTTIKKFDVYGLPKPKIMWSNENYENYMVLYRILYGDMLCLGRPYHIKFFKGCLPQILLDPFLNTLTHICQLLGKKPVIFNGHAF